MILSRPVAARATLAHAERILPLSTAYSVCEGLGLEAGVNRRFKEAPEFYWLYTAIIVLSAGMILMPGVPLLKIILASQILNGLLLEST